MGSSASRRSLKNPSFYNVEVLDDVSDKTYDFTVSDTSSVAVEDADEIEPIDSLNDSLENAMYLFSDLFCFFSIRNL